jgi:ER lumen protein retaining receptor
VFVTRYLDLFTNFYSVYNTVLKVVFLASTAYTIYLITHRHRATYDHDHDDFRIEYLIVPCALLGWAVAGNRLSVTDVLWTFSIVLESVAILPQIFLLQRTGEVENLTADYIVALGLYRGLYLLNWVWRYFTEPGYSAVVVWIFGAIQTALYCDFFYYYFVSRLQGKKLVLPS